jgi:undecaprenyl-diphosphatase
VITAAALGVFLACAAVAWDGDVPSWEADTLRFVNGWPDRLEPFFWVVQQAGVLGAPLAGGVVIAAIARRWTYLVPFACLVPLKLGIEWGVIKQLVERERPFATLGSEIVVRGTAVDGLSFPSGHATTATAFGVLLLAFVPRSWWPPVVGWVGAVGLARLYSGEHHPLDVVGGIALGTIYGVALRYLVLDRLVAESRGG